MQHSISRLTRLCLLVSSAHAALASGQPVSGPSIELDPAIECWFHSEFPTLTAVLSAPESVVRSRLYFRCSTYPDYYFVDLAAEPSGAGFTALAPRAEPSCPSVHYYVEALGSDFTSSRTEERVAEVTDTDACRRRYPTAAWFPGEEPGIVLGSTVSGPAFAPGFSEAGITGFVSATGATSAVAGGGLSTGAVAGLAAGGAAAGVGVLVASGSTSSSPDAADGPKPPVSPSPATTTTIPAVSGPGAPSPPSPLPSLAACFTLEPPSGRVNVNDALTIDGRCSEGGDSLSFRYDLGDGRMKEGQAFVTAIWPLPGRYTLTLTVSRPDSFGFVLEEDSISREIRVDPDPAPEPPPTMPPAPPDPPTVASFSTRNLNVDTCHVEFDGSASTGNIVSYAWELDTINAFNRGVVRATGPVVSHDWGADCFRAKGVSFAKLTVTGQDGSVDVLEKQFDALTFGSRGEEPSGSSGIDTAFVMEIVGGGDAASVAIHFSDGSSRTIGRGTSAVRLGAGTGWLELLAADAGSGRDQGPLQVRLDFSTTRGFVPGSLRLVSGRAVAEDAYSLVLRFGDEGGGDGEVSRARVQVELRP